mmetsp:Transcript_12147/g.34046  ORF Transcript_12147/g.34046 Transcript_12147/m.34046 type:complete len:333 (+) Transcript_12147:169-1167(+)
MAHCMEVWQHEFRVFCDSTSSASDPTRVTSVRSKVARRHRVHEERIGHGRHPRHLRCEGAQRGQPRADARGPLGRPPRLAPAGRRALRPGRARRPLVRPRASQPGPPLELPRADALKKTWLGVQARVHGPLRASAHADRAVGADGAQQGAYDDAGHDDGGDLRATLRAQLGHRVAEVCAGRGPRRGGGRRRCRCRGRGCACHDCGRLRCQHHGRHYGCHWHGSRCRCRYMSVCRRRRERRGGRERFRQNLRAPVRGGEHVGGRERRHCRQWSFCADGGVVCGTARKGGHAGTRGCGRDRGCRGRVRRAYCGARCNGAAQRGTARRSNGHACA